MSFYSQSAHADDIGDRVTGIQSGDAFYNGSPINQDETPNWDMYTNYQISYKYGINSGATVKEGDTARVDLPNGTVFGAEQSFPLKAPDGSIVGNFKAKAGSTYGTITFTKYYATNINDRGGEILLSVRGTKDTGGHGGNDSYIGKNGYGFNGWWKNQAFPLDANDRYQYAAWDAKINPNKASITNAIITDTLQDLDKQEMVLDPTTSTPLIQLKYEDGTDVPESAYELAWLPTSGKPTSFTIKWNGVLDKTVNLFYLTKITDPGYRESGNALTLHNDIKITGNVSGGSGGGIIVDTKGEADATIDLGGSGTGGGTQFSINVKKNWDGVPVGLQTPAIQAVLYMNGKITEKEITLDTSNGYAGTFKDLYELDANNQKIAYTVAEKSIPKGYSGTLVPQEYDSSKTVTLTNTYIPPEKTTIKVNKLWAGVPDGVTTPGVTVTLYKNGEKTDQTLTLNKDNNYSGEFADLLKTDDQGDAIKYTVVETPVEGYTTDNADQAPDKDGKVIFNNQYIAEKTKISVNKAWAGVPEGVNTPAVTVTLYENGQKTDQQLTLNKDNHYTGEFTELPKTDSRGDEIEYTVVEAPIDGYTIDKNDQAPDKDGKVTFNNQYIPEKTQISVNKVWGGVPDGVNTPAVTVTLYRNGQKTDQTLTLDKDNNYAGEFKDLPKTDDKGATITYTVSENSVDGYTTEKDNQTPDQNGKVTFNNQYIAEKTKISVNKVWTGVPNGVNTPEVTVTLYQDGQKTPQTLTLNKDNNYAGEFTELPKTDSQGAEIKYTAVETPVEGYTTDNDNQAPDKDGKVTFSNQYIAEKTKITVNKLWSGVPEGVNTPEVTVTLYRNGEKTADSRTLNKGNNYTGEFTGLPKTDEKGAEIKYTVVESAVAGYTTDKDDQAPDKDGEVTFNNQYIPEETKINVNKIWGGVPDGVNTPEVTVTLYKNGQKTDQTLTLNKDNQYSGEFDGLPKTDSKGNEIKYTVVESAVAGYKTDKNDQAPDKDGKITFSNQYIAEKTNISVNKLWGGVPDGVVTPEVTVTLYENGEKTAQTLTLNKDNHYSGEFKGLPKTDSNGSEIKYTVSENPVDGYTIDKNSLAPDNDGKVTFNNQFIPQNTSISVNKIWAGVPEGVTTPEVTVTLYKNGEKTDQTLQLKEENNYSGEFKELPKTDSQGAEIKYTVVETKVDGYTTDKEDQAPDKDGKVTFNNQYIPENTKISVNKVWSGVPEGVNTPEVTATLYKNGEKTGQTLPLNKGNNYSGEFKDLPKTDDKGDKIKYTVVESAVAGYTTDKNNQTPDKDGKVTFNNQYIPEKTKITVNKLWAGVPEGVVTPEVTVTLYRNGVKTDQILTLTKDKNYSGEFKDLPKTDNKGAEFKYTVEETTVDGYTTDKNDQAPDKDGKVTFNNQYIPEKTKITVNKLWAGVPDGVATPEVIVTLYKNDEKTEKSLTLNKGNLYTGEFTDLPKTDDKGGKIKYTVVETPVKGYTTDKDDQAPNKDGKVTFNNQFIAEKTKIKVNKLWKGVPANVVKPTVVAVLYENGVKTDKKVELNALNNWTAEFTDLPVTDADGKPIIYTIAEESVPGGYVSSTSGMQTVKDGAVTLINEYVPGKSSITVNKAWQGVPKGVETPRIVVTLYANGKPTGQTLTLDGQNGYLGRFDNLPETDSNGNPITYTVEETVVDGYTSTTTGQRVANNGLVTLVNVFTPRNTSIKVVKEWCNTPCGTIPPTITATLFANGKMTDKIVTLDRSNHYSATFDNLPETDKDGNPIIYTVAETLVPNGYRTSTAGQQPVKNGVIILKNIYIPDTPVNPCEPKNPTCPNKPTCPNTPGNDNNPGETIPTNETGLADKAVAQNSATPSSGQTSQSTAASVPVNAPTEKLPQTGDQTKQQIALTVIGLVLIAMMLIWKFAGLGKKM
ncbi:MAG: Cna B-type domain-containing protein [Lentilactobacillus sunkii]|uniref:Cna B-type domain-containing protein n=1 Tax=Lentilactobacillus sunkii TaxID=481719 RepID=UPI002F360FC2